METRTVSVESMDGLSTEEKADERARLEAVGLGQGWTGDGRSRGQFDDLLDDVHSTFGDASGQTAELEEVKAWEERFLMAARDELTSRLLGSGMFCGRAFVDPMKGDGYTFVFRDGEARRFSVTISVDDCLELRMALGEEWGRPLIDRLTGEAYKAREAYFARMM